MPNTLKSALAIAVTILLTEAQYVNPGGLMSAVEISQEATGASDQGNFAVYGDFGQPSALLKGAELIDALQRNSSEGQDSFIDLAARGMQSAEQTTGATDDPTTTYKFVDTERIHIFMWTGILLAITTYMGVMAFFNMPLKKDPLLYTKLYSSSAH